MSITERVWYVFYLIKKMADAYAVKQRIEPLWMLLSNNAIILLKFTLPCASYIEWFLTGFPQEIGLLICADGTIL